MMTARQSSFDDIATAEVNEHGYGRRHKRSKARCTTRAMHLPAPALSTNLQRMFAMFALNVLLRKRSMYWKEGAGAAGGGFDLDDALPIGTSHCKQRVIASDCSEGNEREREENIDSIGLITCLNARL